MYCKCVRKTLSVPQNCILNKFAVSENILFTFKCIILKCRLSFHKYAWTVVLHKDILPRSLISLHYDWGCGWIPVHRMSRCVQQLLLVHLKPRSLQRLKAECYWLSPRSAEVHIQCPAAAHTDAETVIKSCSAPAALNPLSVWQPCNCFHLQTLCQVTDLGSGNCQVSLPLCFGGVYLVIVQLGNAWEKGSPWC